MKEHPPISVALLAKHVAELKADNSAKFTKEYEVKITHCNNSDINVITILILIIIIISPFWRLKTKVRGEPVIFE